MSNDEGLVDEFERIENLKRELEQKEADLKKKIIELALQKKVNILFGKNKKCSVKEYKKVIYPVDKTPIVSLLKDKGLWDDLSMINYPRFGSRAVKGLLDWDLMSLIRKEKAFRVSLKDIEGG